MYAYNPLLWKWWPTHYRTKLNPSKVMVQSTSPPHTTARLFNIPYIKSPSLWIHRNYNNKEATGTNREFGLHPLHFIYFKNPVGSIPSVFLSPWFIYIYIYQEDYICIDIAAWNHLELLPFFFFSLLLLCFLFLFLFFFNDYRYHVATRNDLINAQMWCQ